VRTSSNASIGAAPGVAMADNLPAGHRPTVLCSNSNPRSSN